MIICKICKIRKKDIVLLKCCHTFCRVCIEEMVDSRNRKCPTCRENIFTNDIADIYWD